MSAVYRRLFPHSDDLPLFALPLDCGYLAVFSLTHFEPKISDLQIAVLEVWLESGVILLRGVRSPSLVSSQKGATPTPSCLGDIYLNFVMSQK